MTSTTDLAARDDAHVVADAAWGPKLWGTIAILCGALFLAAMDVSSVNVALPTCSADAGCS